MPRCVWVCVETRRVPHSSVKLLLRIYANNAKYSAYWLIPLSEKSINEIKKCPVGFFSLCNFFVLLPHFYLTRLILPGLLSPTVDWTWHRWPVCGVRGKNCQASTRSCLETCRMCSTHPGIWPNTATSWAARACSLPSSHCSQWSRRTSPSYMKVGTKHSLCRNTQMLALLVLLPMAFSVVQFLFQSHGLVFFFFVSSFFFMLF